MTVKQLVWVRWLALVPCALLAAVIVKIGSEAVFRYVLVVSVGLEPWTSWVAKGLAALLMGVAFVLTAGCVAPRFRVLVSASALGIVLIWSAGQYLAILDAGSLMAPLAVGAGCAAGGMLAFLLIARMRAP